MGAIFTYAHDVQAIGNPEPQPHLLLTGRENMAGFVWLQ